MRFGGGPGWLLFAAPELGDAGSVLVLEHGCVAAASRWRTAASSTRERDTGGIGSLGMLGEVCALT